MSKTSQPIKWHGGKSGLAKWIHENAPSSVNDDPVNGYTHRNIPFAGGLGELWGWECEGISETVNDINSWLANFWRVMADEALFKRFSRVAEAIPFGDHAWQECHDYIKLHADGVTDTKKQMLTNATVFFVRYRQSRQGLGKDFATPTKRIRRGMNENVSAWLSAVEGLPECHERLKRVEVRSMDAVKFIRKYDHERALFYADPPYLHKTRTDKNSYAYEMIEGGHRELLSTLKFLKGKFMLSGYRSYLYDDFASSCGWRRVEKDRPNSASSKKTKDIKTECLWMNY